jgi:hypothetical protein
LDWPRSQNAGQSPEAAESALGADEEMERRRTAIDCGAKGARVRFSAPPRGDVREGTPKGVRINGGAGQRVWFLRARLARVYGWRGGCSWRRVRAGSEPYERMF